jgi:serine/threonine-protein kinase
MRSGTPAAVDGGDVTLDSARGSGAPGIAVMSADAGAAVSETRPAVAESPVHPVDAGQPAPTGERGSVALDAGQVAPDARAAARTVVVAANPEQAPPSRAVAAPVVPSSPPQAKKTGELAILVKPWALVWLNGKPLNQTPYRETIPVGRYRVRLRNDDLGKDETTTVVVNADQTTTIERKW